jgi:hypothetical protein
MSVWEVIVGGFFVGGMPMTRLVEWSSTMDVRGDLPVARLTPPDPAISSYALLLTNQARTSELSAIYDDKSVTAVAKGYGRR